MPITIFKSSSIHADNHIISELEDLLFNGRAYLITPTKGGALTIQKNLLKKSPLIGNRVLSIHELIKRLASPHKPILPKEICLLLLFEIMKKGIYKSPTLQGVSSVLDIINFVNRNHLVPKNKNNHLHKIFAEYNNKITSSSFTDDSNLTNICLNNIKERKLKLPKSIGFIGFPRFLNGEIEIVKAIEKHYPNIDILISHPFLPNEEIQLNGKCVDINEKTKKAKIEIYSLSSLASELRFSARILAKKQSKTIITRRGQEGSPSFITKLYEEGFTPLFNDQIFISGLGYISSIIKRLPNNDAKIGRFCADLLNQAEKQIKNKTILGSTLFENLRKIKIWSDLILKDNVPKHIFVELLELLEISSSSLTELSSAYPFNWSLFEDGIFPNTETIICGLTVDNYPKLNLQTHPIIEGWWYDITCKNSIIEDECLFKRLIESVPKLIITFPTTNSNGVETHQSPFIEILDCKIKNISVFPLIPISSDYDKRLEIEFLKTKNINLPERQGYIHSKECLDIIRKKKGKPPKFGITELELYANCPFEYFVRYILGAKELEEKDLALLPMDRGKFAHKLLSKVLTNESILMNNEKLKKHINLALHSMENDLPEYFHKALWEWEKKNLFNWAMNVINNAKANTILPKGPDKFITEWSFGDGQNPSLEFRLNSGDTVKLKGRIDRIDISKDNSCFSIVDYKTSASKVKKSELEEATHLQLPLYMHAVETLLLKDMSPVGGFIYSLKNDESSLAFGKKYFNKLFFDSKNRSQYDDDLFEQLRNNIIQKTKEYISNILKGDFGYNGTKCDKSCKLKTICKSKGRETGF